MARLKKNRKAKRQKRKNRKIKSTYAVKVDQKIKRANQRIVQLFKSGYSTRSEFINILQRAYGSQDTTKKQFSKFYSFRRDNLPKFRTDTALMTLHELQALNYEVERFLKSEGSTVSGQKKQEERRKKAFEEYARKNGGTVSSYYLEQLFSSPNIRRLIKERKYISDEIKVIGGHAEQNGYSVAECIQLLVTYINDGDKLMKIVTTPKANRPKEDFTKKE